MKNCTLLFFGMFMILMSCDTKKEEQLMLKKSDQFYVDYFKSELLKKGVKNTAYFKVAAEEADYEGLNHSEIMSNIEKAIPLIKQNYEMDKQQRLTKLKVFIATIKKHNLDEKEPFYKILVSDISDDEKLDFYYKEERNFFDALGKSKELGDVELSNQVHTKYSYLNLLARDTNNNIVNFDAVPLEQRTVLTYSIEKYDVEYKKAMELQNKKVHGSTSALYINDIKVE